MMPIPESQLETWSRQGPITQSSNTYNSIKSVLESRTTSYAKKKFKVYLQGSYGNATNIYAESDVDIVIQLDDCFHSDLESLSDTEKSIHKLTYCDAPYTHVDFKRDVLTVLKNQYGSALSEGNKAISIDANGSRRKVDVIIATQFRRYFKFRSVNDMEYIEGICFFDSSGNQIANYPKQHSANLTLKHQSTNQWLKPMIRILKNLRSKLVAEGAIDSKIAPSYYLEGLLYNVPPEKLGSSYQDSFVNAMDWIQTKADRNKLLCANEQYYLLWNNSQTSWERTDALAFIDAAIDLWNNW